MKKQHTSAICLVISLMLILLYIPAHAENALLDLWNAGCTLAFDTRNADIEAEATFYLDGECFKKMKASYLKDGVDSDITLHLSTPLYTGEIRENGWRVIGRAGMAWSLDEGDEYYSSWGYDPTASLVRNPLLGAAIRTAGTVLSAAPGMQEISGITVSDAENDGKIYTIKVNGDALPSAMHEAIMPLLNHLSIRLGYGTVGSETYSDAAYADSFGSEDDAHEYDSSLESSDDYDLYDIGSMVQYDDFDACFEAAYERLYGEAIPEDFYPKAFADETGEGREWLQYLAVWEEIDAMEQKLYHDYPDAYIIQVHADQTVDCYMNHADYIRGNNDQRVIYEDEAVAFAAYYLSRTGEELQPDVYEAAMLWLNEDLANAVYEMLNEMNEAYIQQARDAGYLGVWVRKNGTVLPLRCWDEILAADYNYTTVERILWMMQDIRIDTLDLSAETQPDGRLSSLKGTAAFIVNLDGTKHLLTVELDAAISYGSTDLSMTTTDVFGVPDWNGWYEQNADRLYQQYDSYDETEEDVFPETVTFMGTEYKLSQEYMVPYEDWDLE